MDVRLIMKRLNFLENVAEVLLEEHQRMALYLSDPPTIDQMGKIRQIHEESHDLLHNLSETDERSLNLSQIKGSENS